MKNTSLLLSFLLSFSLWSQNAIDVKHYALHLTLDPSQEEVILEELIEIQLNNDALQIELDLVGLNKDGLGMQVTAVTISKKAIKWRQLPDRLILEIPKKYKNEVINVLIFIQGKPQDGLVISKNKFGAPTIFADNWPNRARHWYACHDHPSDKATYTFDVLAPPSYEVVANGSLAFGTPKKEVNGLVWWCYHINEPIATKVAVVGVAELRSKNMDTIQGIPVNAFVYPEDSINGFASFKVAPTILDFYQKTIGPYPFTQLHNVQSTTRYGGMENAGCIFYDEASLNNNRKSKLLIAHEIAHQWFGNSVTESDWQHLWLSEGFATYLTNFYIEQSEGQQPFHQQLAQDRMRVINFSKSFQAPLIDSLTLDLNERLNPNAYQKGSWVLHMLRVQLGDSLFWAGIRNFYNEFQYQNATSEAFWTSMEKSTGQDLDDFFKQWLYQSGHPVIDAKLSEEDGQQFFELRQLQKEQFQFPLKVSFYYDNGEMSVQKFTINDSKHRFALPQITGKTITKFQLDPNTELLFEEVKN
jgi:aminopeptidase N